jgi:hypothetical protein
VTKSYGFKPGGGGTLLQQTRHGRTVDKEGKQAVKMARLSCHRFRANEVRLWLSVIAYNFGNLWRRLALPGRIGNWSLTSLQQRLVKTGERLIKHGAVLLAATGGESPRMTAVHPYAAENYGAAGVPAREPAKAASKSTACR